MESNPNSDRRVALIGVILATPVVGNPGVTVVTVVVLLFVTVADDVAVFVPLQGLAVMVLYPNKDVHPERKESATESPLHGTPLVVLYPIGVEQPTASDVAVDVPLQGSPSVILYPIAEAHPLGKVAA